jgi:voltage-gated potassium channel
MMPLQRRTWEVLEVAQSGDRGSRTFDIGILLLIALNVVAVILETVQPIEVRYGDALLWFERVSVLVFSIEYLARIWSAPADERYRGAVRGRLRFVRTPLAVVDLLAVLPFFLPALGVDLRFIRALRLMRLFRIAKAGRYMNALRLFHAVAVSKREELVLTTCVLALLLLVASSLMYFAGNGAQPDAFSSIPATMWWAVPTLTTVGYGDIYPVTALGRVLGSAVAVLGVGLFALPTAILGSGFVDEIGKAKRPPRCPRCGNDLPGGSGT